MPKERYNIKEFAAIVGRSEQGVYARLSKRLKPYLTERGGVLMLDYKAFSDVYGLSKDCENQSSPENKDRNFTFICTS